MQKLNPRYYAWLDAERESQLAIKRAFSEKNYASFTIKDSH